MKLKLISYLIFCVFGFSFSQSSIKGLGSFGSDFINSFSYNEDFSIMPNVNFGIKYSTELMDISLVTSYGYSFNAQAPNFFLKFHELGGKFEFDFLKNVSRFNPYVSIGFYTEIGQKNKNRMLHYRILYPFYFPDKTSISSGSHGSHTVYKYSTRFYYKTPILSFFNFGCNVKLAEDLNLKVGIGYGLQVMKTRAYSWISNDANSQNQWLYEENADIETTISSQPKESHFFHLLDAQVGISYSFPFKKKTKE